MKRLMILALALLYVLTATALAWTDKEGFASGGVKNDGLLVRSLEDYTSSMGTELAPCNSIFQEKNYYCYEYSKRALPYKKKPGDSLTWSWAQAYAEMLCLTGYFQQVQPNVQRNSEVFYLLEYVGPGEVKNTFSIRKSDPKAAIVVASYWGDLKIYYSIDILTTDLDETQERLGKNISVNGKSNDDPWEHNCIVCGFDGKCDTCGGSGQVYNWVPGTNEYVWQTCTAYYCQNGSCQACGGDGKN